MATLINSVLGQVASGTFKLVEAKDINLGSSTHISNPISIPTTANLDAGHDFILLDEGKSIFLYTHNSGTQTKCTTINHGLTVYTYVSLRSPSGTGYDGTFQIVDVIDTSNFVLDVAWAGGTDGDQGCLYATESSVKRATLYDVWLGIKGRLQGTANVIDDTIMLSNDIVTYPKMQNVATANRVLGSTSAGGVISEVQVSQDMLGADCVDGSKISDDSIDSEHYVDGSIDTAHIADNQVTYGKMQIAADNNKFLGTGPSSTAITEISLTRAHHGTGYYLKDEEIRLDTTSYGGYILANDATNDHLDEAMEKIEGFRPGYHGYMNVFAVSHLDFKAMDGGMHRFIDYETGAVKNSTSSTITLAARVFIPNGYKLYRAKVYTMVFGGFANQVVRLKSSSTDSYVGSIATTTTSNVLATWNFTPSDAQDYGYIEVDLVQNCKLGGADVYLQKL